MKHFPLLPPALVLLVSILVGCSEPDGRGQDAFRFVAEDDTLEAVSLLDTPLYRARTEGERGDRMRAQLEEARMQWEQHPDSVESYIWYGRRLAYLGRYRDAIEVYTRGLEKFPDEPRLLRHRGHRFVTIRNLDRAIQDFERAAAAVAGLPDEVEPDGQPNAADIPTSTLQTNIWYHLGLAHYLQGNYDGAVEAFQRCFDLASNNDMRVASADWLYMSLRRAGWHDEAERAIEFVTPGMDILENHAYHQRLLLYRGLSGDDGIESIDWTQADGVQVATLGYGVANWHLMEGRNEQATDLFERVLQGSSWAAFGYIASEAQLAAGPN